MRITVFLLALVFLAACASDDPYKRLKKLSGTWMVSDGEGGAYEEWSRSLGDSMVGRAYKLSGPTDTIVSETIVLKKDDSAVWFTPTVAGQNNNSPVRFRLVDKTDSSFTFENKEHDFPQRIIYRFVHDDSIVATIEGLDSNVRRFFDFYYSRVR